MEVVIGILAILIAVAAMLYKWRVTWSGILEDERNRKPRQGRQVGGEKPPDAGDR